MPRVSIFSLSQTVADSAFGLFNLMLIIGSVLALAGTVGIFWTSGIRERYADTRIKENEAKTAVAVAESARANESNTRLKLELERERVERLRLEQRVAPRSLTSLQRQKLVGALRFGGWRKGEVIWHGTGEPEAYAREFASAFNEVGIETNVHTLGIFIPSAWGLMIVISVDDSSARLKSIFDAVGIDATLVETNDTLGRKSHPTVFVGSRDD